MQAIMRHYGGYNYTEHHEGIPTNPDFLFIFHSLGGDFSPFSAFGDSTVLVFLRSAKFFVCFFRFLNLHIELVCTS